VSDGGEGSWMGKIFVIRLREGIIVRRWECFQPEASLVTIEAYVSADPGSRKLED
jgi:hypothetical protein